MGTMNAFGGEDIVLFNAIFQIGSAILILSTLSIMFFRSGYQHITPAKYAVAVFGSVLYVVEVWVQSLLMWAVAMICFVIVFVAVLREWAEMDE